jgi:hypothetical protein
VHRLGSRGRRRDIVEFLRSNDMVVEVYDTATCAVTSND